MTAWAGWLTKGPPRSRGGPVPALDPQLSLISMSPPRRSWRPFLPSSWWTGSPRQSDLIPRSKSQSPQKIHPGAFGTCSPGSRLCHACPTGTEKLRIPEFACNGLCAGAAYPRTGNTVRTTGPNASVETNENGNELATKDCGCATHGNGVQPDVLKWARWRTIVRAKTHD